MMKLRVLDLFSGIGGFSLGLERTNRFETVAFCEIDPFCQKVLKKHWPEVPILEDVRKIDANGLGRIDVVTGGYPCQPFSTAGKRQGDQDDRHLWPAMFEVIKAVRPAWVIGENVAGHVSMGLDNVLSDLEGEGYTCRPYIIPACAVDAKHRRDRVWIVAHSSRCDDGRSSGQDEGKSKEERLSKRDKDRFVSQSGEICTIVANTGSKRTQCLPKDDKNTQRKSERGTKLGWNGENVANTRSAGRQEQHSATITEGQEYSAGGNAPGRGSARWPAEPGICRVAHGIPNRVDRLRSLGNAVVPQVVEVIGNAILEAENER